MRKLLIILLLLPAALIAQTKATGIWYFEGTPNVQPTSTRGVEVAININTGTMYRWVRGADEWRALVTDVSFDTTGLRNNVYLLTTISDTISIANPTEGDFFVKDSTTFGVYGDQWHVLYGGGGGGGGGPVSWNDIIMVPSNVVNAIDSVAHDLTLIGQGRNNNKLRVDTNLVATQSYVETELDNRIEVEFIYYANVAGSTVVLPFTPDTRYPISSHRGGVRNTVSRTGANNTDWRLNGGTLTANHRPLEAGEYLITIFTKQQ